MLSTGVVFVSLFAAAASFKGASGVSNWVLGALVVGVVTLGVPHGGLDHLTGRELLKTRFSFAWGLLFFPAYLAAASLVATGWFLLPFETAIAFFVVSAWHFGLEDDRTRVDSPVLDHLCASAVGGLVIWIPALAQPARVTAILQTIVPANFLSAMDIVGVTQVIACVLVPVAFVVFARDLNRKQWRRLTRNVCFLLLFGLADPLVSFGIYFCGWHSVRGLGRLARVHNKTAMQLAVSTAPLTLGAIALALVGMWLWSAGQTLSDATSRSLFIGLSAIAVPHLVLHGPISGWLASSPAARDGALRKWGGALVIALNDECQYDCILVGGGLQSGLLALALRHHHPDARVLLIEGGGQLGGNHTWSFHPGDVPPSCRNWVQPLIQHQWSGYEVGIGRLRRHVDLKYASISSEHFADVIGEIFRCESATDRHRLERVTAMASAGGDALSVEPGSGVQGESGSSDAVDSDWQLLVDTHVEQVSEGAVLTAGGQTYRGNLVVDCRGPSQAQAFGGCGFQKFHGFEIELSEDWPHASPVVMESVADQGDGFRFLYTLPFSRRRVLVEDTRFSDTPDCDRQACLQLVTKHVHDLGIRQFDIVREESGVLPMPFTSELPPEAHSPLIGGYAGGWFHAATGYSFPLAVAFAQAVAEGPLSSAAGRVAELSAEHRLRSLYSRFLNRLLFRLVTPTRRHQVFRRFYRVLSDTSIERFFSHRFTASDAFRIVVGIPPTLIGLRPLRFFRSFFSGANH